MRFATAPCRRLRPATQEGELQHGTPRSVLYEREQGVHDLSDKGRNDAVVSFGQVAPLLGTQRSLDQEKAFGRLHLSTGVLPPPLQQPTVHLQWQVRCCGSGLPRTVPDVHDAVSEETPDLLAGPTAKRQQSSCVLLRTRHGARVREQAPRPLAHITATRWAAHKGHRVHGIIDAPRVVLAQAGTAEAALAAASETQPVGKQQTFILILWHLAANVA
mmetsp:Transcript_9900/g.27604  ORF Transcript_9900/g.27604 Transcript_9900/m.27604 type:complete len:217 (+) Transcript_9900:301-951(+)